ncbi:hypothetical protein BV898_15972 [Hypsibius exemplaris]|uniref:HTH psq-type domain-containing protein n=1 Tax=Hypsibius exemplaris TaxID=2072580 RepID=A0A9X6NCE3_HYPEX|nr:hypothetical protein BV898_15972 [Hypsibius exemplaris]
METPMEAAYNDVLHGTLSFRKAAVKHSVSHSTLRRYFQKKAAEAAPRPGAATDKEPKMDPKQAMQEAMDAVRNGGRSLRKAAKEYGITYSTLSRHLANPDIKKPGAQQKFTEAEELQMETLLTTCAEMGVPLSRTLLQHVKTAFAEGKGLVNEDKYKFGGKWRTEFMKRHPAVAELVKTASHRAKAVEWNTKQCAEWIALLEDVNEDGFIPPGNVWNLDVADLDLNQLFAKLRAAKNPHQSSLNFVSNPKEIAHVLTCVNATGVASANNVMRPLVQVTMAGTESEDADELNFGAAWNDATFAAYFRDEVIPHMPEDRNYVFVDLRFTHLGNLEFVKVCLNSGKDIRIVCIPSCQSGKMKPLQLDKYIAGSNVESRWGQFLRDHHPLLFVEPLCLENFTAHMTSLYPAFNLAGAVKDGLARTGAYPFSPAVIEAIPKRKFTERIWTKADVFAGHKHRLRDVLADMGLTAADVSALVTEADRRAKFNAAAKNNSTASSGSSASPKKRKSADGKRA